MNKQEQVYNPKLISFLDSAARLRVLNAFLLQLDEYRNEMEKAVTQTDYSKMKRIAHQLTGSGRTLGIDGLVTICREIEMELNIPNPVSDQVKMKTLFRVMGETKKSIKLYSDQLVKALDEV